MAVEHWSAAEDRIMRAAVMKYGTNQWNRVASLLATKTAAQCRARWFEHLDPRIAARAWTPAEDRRLRELQRRMPNMWRSIGAALGSRTAEQCFARWTELQPRDGLEEAPAAAPADAEPAAERQERQMLAEAEARLANSMGRKAKRKQRERLEAERAFLDSVQRHRETGAAIQPGKRRAGAQPPALPLLRGSAELQPPALPGSSSSSSSSTGGGGGGGAPSPRRRPNRAKLRLPAPRTPAAEVPPPPPPKCSRERTRAVLQRLESMPEPRGRTLADLYEAPAREEPQEAERSLERARALVREELAGMRGAARGARARGAAYSSALVQALERRQTLFDRIRQL